MIVKYYEKNPNKNINVVGEKPKMITQSEDKPRLLNMEKMNKMGNGGFFEGLGAEEHNKKKKRSTVNDGSGKQKLMRLALSDSRKTRGASKQQQHFLEFPYGASKQQQQRFQEFPCGAVKQEFTYGAVKQEFPCGASKQQQQRFQEFPYGASKQQQGFQEFPYGASKQEFPCGTSKQEFPCGSSNQQQRFQEFFCGAFKQQFPYGASKQQQRFRKFPYGASKQHQHFQDFPYGTSKQQQNFQEFPGFDVGDVPPNGLNPRHFPIPLSFQSHWTENSPDPAPKQYEDMAKIGLETYNRQNDTLYQFTKILRVDSLSKCIYVAYHITFQAEDESSPKNFEAKAASIRDITVVPFCKLEKGLDVAVQTETLSDLAVSAFTENQKKRQQLLREETRRIKERRGFDLGDIPPLVPFPNVAPYQIYEPCWSESCLNPAPKLYEEMSKMAIKNYNHKFHTAHQFTKILNVYFYKRDKQGKSISRFIYFQVEDTSVACPKNCNFEAQVVSTPQRVLISSCSQKEVGSIDLNAIFDSICGINKSVWYWSSPDEWFF